MVCEHGDNRDLYNKKWELVRSFGGFGKEDGHLWRPNAAIVSPEGNSVTRGQ